MEEFGLILLAVGCFLIGIWAFLYVIFNSNVSYMLGLGISLVLAGIIIYLIVIIYNNLPRKL